MKDIKALELTWQSLVRHSLIISGVLVSFNGWVFLKAYSSGEELNLIASLIGIAISFFAFSLSLLSSSESCNPSNVARTYASVVLAFGWSAIVFSWFSRSMAEPGNRWLYVDYSNAYLATFILAILISAGYIRRNEKLKSYFATLRSRLEQDPNRPVIKSPESTRENSLTSASIVFIGFSVAIVASLTLGRAAGLLYTSFLSCLVLGPLLLVFWIINIIPSRRSGA